MVSRQPERRRIAGNHSAKRLFTRLFGPSVFYALLGRTDTAGEYFDNEGIAYQIDCIAISSGRPLYIDENDRLVALPEAMKPLTPVAFWSATGVWYEPDPSGRYRALAWPVWPGLGADRANETRRRLCLDTLAEQARRKPWVRMLPLAKFKESLGIRD